MPVDGDSAAENEVDLDADIKVKIKIQNFYGIDADIKEDF